MSEFESTLRRIIREEVLAVLTEMLPQFRSHPTTPLSDMDESFLLSTREAAKRLAISERTLYSLTQSGQIPCVRLGMSKRYSVKTIKAWIQKSEAVASQVPKPASGLNVQRTIRPIYEKSEAPKRTQKKTPKSGAIAGSQSSPKPSTERNQKEVEQVKPLSPLGMILQEIGVDRTVLPTISKGDLMRVTGVDIPTLHGWVYHGRRLPEDALEKLREHFAHLKAQSKQV